MMKINYAIVEAKDTTIVPIYKTDYQEDGQVICLYDLLNIDTDCFDINVYDNYVAFAFTDYLNNDEWYFGVFKLNSDEYNKRLEESNRGYHTGMFWLWDDLFDSIKEDDILPTYEQMIEGLKSNHENFGMLYDCCICMVWNCAFRQEEIE